MPSSRSSARWAPLAGIGAVVLFVAAFVTGGSSPDSGDSDAKILSYLAKDSNQNRNFVAFFILLLSALLLVCFFASLRSRLAQAERGTGGAANLAFGAGILNAALLVIAIALFISPMALADDVGAARVDPSAYRITQDAGYLIWFSSVVLGSLAQFATASVVLRTKALPGWFGWTSAVMGVLSLFAVFFIPILLFWVWVLIASIVMALRPPLAAPVARAAAEPAVETPPLAATPG